VDAAEQSLNMATDMVDQLTLALELLPDRIAEAESAIAAAKAREGRATTNVERCTVKAPFTGRVKMVAAEQGQYVAPGVGVVTLADDSVLEIAVVDVVDGDRFGDGERCVAEVFNRGTSDADETTTTSQAAATITTQAPETTGRVLVAAKGKPHDAVRTLSDRVVAYLRERGVDAESATGGIPVVEDSKMVLPLLLQRGQTDGAGSVLLLSADFVSMQKVALDCYEPGGAKLWKVKVSGGTGWKGRPYSKTGITEELAERFMEKLDKKIGGPGLPVSQQ
jgi:hypothetical protein